MASDAELWERAQVYADRHYPRAKYEPTNAGFTGLMVVGAVLAVFTGLARRPDIGIPGLVTLAIGFAAPYFYFKRGNDKNTSAKVEEYRRLSELQKSTSTSV